MVGLQTMQICTVQICNKHKLARYSRPPDLVNITKQEHTYIIVHHEEKALVSPSPDPRLYMRDEINESNSLKI